jgi:hypothetical protein
MMVGVRTGELGLQIDGDEGLQIAHCSLEIENWKRRRLECAGGPSRPSRCIAWRFN